MFHVPVKYSLLSKDGDDHVLRPDYIPIFDCLDTSFLQALFDSCFERFALCPPCQILFQIPFAYPDSLPCGICHI